VPAFQIDGLFSGLQTGAMLDKMISLERQPVMRLNSKVAVLKQRKQTLSELRSKLSTFESVLANVMKAATLNKKATTVAKSDGTVSAAVSATAGLNAANGPFQVTVNQLATASTATSTAKIGDGVSAGSVLEDAGLVVALATTESAGTSGTFSINGTSVSVDYAVDTLNAVVSRVNSTVSGVTATITDADGTANPSGNYLKLSSASAITLGSGADTSNFLTAMNLLGARPKGATVTGTTVTTGALASTAIHIGGVIVTTRATAAGNTAAQNAASIAEDVNGTANIGVVATANTDGTITLVSKTKGVGSSVDITQAGTGTGLSVATTTQATDEWTSISGIGGTQVGASLTSARLTTAISGLDGSGNGEFKINGVSVTFNQNESINAVISRINSSGAGVVASYDSVLDKLVLTSKTTGSMSTGLQDVTGNFLAAVGVLSATQSLGQNSVFSISTVAGGAQQTSTSNTISGLVAGVELTLSQVTTSAVTVTVSQDVAGTVKAVKDFVDQYNFTMAYLREKVKVDPTGKETGLLSYDSILRGLEGTLRRYLNTPVTGLTGTYLNLGDIGLTFGAVGSTVGTTNDLLLSDSKLTAALNESPQTVYALLSGFQSTAVLQGGGTGSVASISGVPTAHHQAGTYLVTTTTTGSISAIFTPTAGVAGEEKFGGTLTAGGTDSIAIPGVIVTATNPLVNGTNTITIAVQQKGIFVDLDDQLKGIASASGLLFSREDAATKETDRINKQISSMEARIAQKRQRLEAQFTQLEKLMSQFQTQSQALQLQLMRLPSSTSRS